MHFRKTVWLVAVAALMLPVFSNAAEHIKPGKWSVTMETDMPGMPMKMPAMTFETCVTPEQAANPQPPKGKRESDCKVEDYKIEGNVVTYKMTCEKSGTTADGKMTFSPESWTAENHMKMKNPRSGESMDVTQKMTGKFAGSDCGTK